MSSPLRENILVSEKRNLCFIGSSRAHQRGASRSSRNVVRDAMDAVVPQDVRRGCVRSSRVVLIPRRWDQVNRVAMSALRARHAEICSRRGLASPVPRGEHGAADKPSCRECRSEFGLPSVTTLVCFFSFASEAAGAASARHSLRPLPSEGQRRDITRAKTRRGNAGACHCDPSGPRDDGRSFLKSETRIPRLARRALRTIS